MPEVAVSGRNPSSTALRLSRDYFDRQLPSKLIDSSILTSCSANSSSVAKMTK